MSKRKEQPQAVEQSHQDDPLSCKIGPQHIVAVLQQRYPQVFDACVGFASTQAQEQQARVVLAERDARIAELEAKLNGKCAVKEAEQIVQGEAAG